MSDVGIVNSDKMFEAACRFGLEGIVAKRMASPYRSGRSKAWLKIKNPKAPAAMRVLYAATVSP